MNPHQSPEHHQCQNDEPGGSIVRDVATGIVVVAVVAFSATALMPLAWLVVIVFARKQRTINGVTVAAITRHEWWVMVVLFPLACRAWWYMVSEVIPDMYREFFVLYWS